MKSWADHCSSDEESDDEVRNTHPAVSSPGKLHPSLHADDEESSVEEELPPHDIAPPVPQKRHYDDLPTHPPFTAYIKNLNFDIRQDDQLAYELQGLLERRYAGTDTRVEIMSAKLGVDKGGSGRKGFGYVQFATLEELVAFLDCDDGHSEIMGRNLHIRVANNQRNDNRREKRQSHTGPPSRRDENTEIDGSKFRGGRYARNNSGKGQNIMSHGGPSGDGNHESSQQPTRQRPSLKLAPRTKPLQDAQKSGGSSSSIFGDAKPRDENQWSTRRSVNFVEENAETMSVPKDTTGAGDNVKAEDASSTASSKDVGMSGDEKDGSETSEGRRPSSSSIGSKGSNGHSERHDKNHHGGRGRGKGRGGGNAHDRNSSSSLGSSGRGGGRGRGRGKWDGSRRDSSGRGGGRGGGGHERKSFTGRGGSSNGDAKKRGSAANVEPSQAVQPQPVAKESKPKTKVTNAFAALNFDSDSD